MAESKLPLSPNGRVSFESVYEPSAMEETQEKKYGVTLLFPKNMTGTQLELFKKLKASAEAVCKEKFGCALSGKYKGKPIKNPFRDGAEKEHLDGYSGDVVFVRFSGRVQPVVVDQNKEPIGRGSMLFYSGCWARVSYTTYAYSKVNNGVGFGLVNVQKVADGKPFAAGVSDPNKDFDELSPEEIAAMESDDASESADLDELLA